MSLNLVDQIGSTITVWTKDGNAMEDRMLHTLDEYGVVVDRFKGDDKVVFVPWSRINYIDYPKLRNSGPIVQDAGIGDRVAVEYVPTEQEQK